MKTGGITIVAALAALACQDAATPVAPENATPAVAAPAAAPAECPCWDEGLLASAFPAVHLHREAEGAASLTRFDHAAAQQVQALVRFAEGGGSCELATFGAAGRIEALAAAGELTETQCAACAGLLAASAAGPLDGAGAKPQE